MKFTAEIRLGNDAMLTSRDLAETLRHMAKRIESNDYVERCKEIGSDIDRVIVDANGNTVGDWHLEE